MENLGRVTPATARVLELLLATERAWGLQLVKEAGKKPGTIYPILDRLESAGWVTGEWDTDESRKGPRRRYYRLDAQARPLALDYVKKQRAKDARSNAPSSPVMSASSWSRA